METQKSLPDSFFTNDKEIRLNCNLYPSETVIKYQRASYSQYHLNLIGILVVTEFRIVFTFKDSKKLIKMNYHPQYFNIPFFQIDKITKGIDKTIASIPVYDILLKDSRVLRFYFWDKDTSIITSININYPPKDSNQYYNFPMKYLKSYEKINFDGWNLYSPEEEFKRQGVFNRKEAFKYTLSNKDYKICPTYPKFLVVHKELSEDNLMDASKHRTKNRLPALSYYYGKGRKGTTNNSAIWRSSQTKSGILGSKNDDDVQYLDKITKLCDKLYIFDARPYLNAVANKANGGGFENVNHYAKAEIVFCDIDNIHAVRASLAKVQQLCLACNIKDNQKFWSSLELTNWYTFIHLLLKFSVKISHTVRKNNSVLIHCSDGWDRTSQLVSLSQLLLDPYYRTIKGFACLIEKDWLSFGHQFAMRNGLYHKEPKEDQRSPIFLQFLDCIHQLLLQFPHSFEFNDTLLVFLANNINSNLYGTFMYNSDNERDEKKAKCNTMSIWSDVMAKVDSYKNNYYQPDKCIDRLKPNYALGVISPWIEFFMQFNYKIKHFGLGEICFRSNGEFYDYCKGDDEVKCDSILKLIMKIKEKDEMKEFSFEIDQVLNLITKKEKSDINSIPVNNGGDDDDELSSSDEEKKEEDDGDLEDYFK